MATQRTAGTVDRFYPDKGFGFVAVSGGEPKFVHQGDIEGRTALRPGQRVSFICAEWDWADDQADVLAPVTASTRMRGR